MGENIKIHYLSPFQDDVLITGGQIYDQNLLNVLGEVENLEIKKHSLELGKYNNFLIFAPILYFFKVLRERDFDVAIINSVYFMRFMFIPIVLKKIFKKKLITVHHHFMYQQFKGLKRLIYKNFEKQFLKQMDEIILASPYVLDELSHLISRDKLKLHQIPFESQQLFTPSPQRGSLIFIGSIESRKGLHLLLESLNILKSKGRNYPVKIIGKVIETGYLNKLEEYIKTNSLDVTFLGHLSKNEKDRLLSQSDVFVFPSLLEGYGMALVEAQVYGLPIVSFDNSAMPYNVKDGKNGFTVKTGDIKSFAESIEKIVEDRTLREELSKGALENLKNQNTFPQFKKDLIKEFGNRVV